VAHRVAAGLRATAERPEVVRPGQPVTGRLHGGDVERVVKPPRVLPLIGAPRDRLADAVGVEPSLRRVAGVERVIDDFGPPDRNVGRQAGIQRAWQLRDRELALEAKVHNLAKRMHAGIGAACRGQRR